MVYNIRMKQTSLIKTNIQENIDSANEERAKPVEVVLIEQTEKKYKMLILMGSLLFWLGIVLMLYNINEFFDLEQDYGKSTFETLMTLNYQSIVEDEPAIRIALWGSITGFVVNRLGKLFAWWNNG